MEELVRDAKCGNNDALEELFARVRPDLINVAKNYLKSIDDCEDAVQNATEIALKRIYKLKSDKYFKTWITRIVINECLKMYKTPHFRELPLDVVLSQYENFSSVDADIAFDNMIATLSDEDKKIYILHHKYDFTIKEVSIVMNMKESTIKSRLNRNNEKLGIRIKRTTLLLIIFACITTSIIAACIFNYVKGLIETKSVGVDNSGMLMAIENLEWFQEVDMDYIDLGDGYKIKVDYLSMDEMSLYLVFDLISKENNISEFDSVALLNLKITNENSDVIYDEESVFNTQFRKVAGSKVIKHDTSRMQFLVFLYTDNFPISKKLNIHFSEISLAKKLKYKTLINTNFNFKIDFEEKFINRYSTSYTATNTSNLKKAIITETGFYSIIELDKFYKTNKSVIIDNNNKSYTCYFYPFTSYDLDTVKYEYIIVSPFNNANSSSLKLIINNEEYILYKN